MSFTSIVKNEIAKLETNEFEKIAELSAIINNSLKEKLNAKITTENPSVARRVFTLLKDVNQTIPKITVRRGFNYQKNYLYILEVNEKTPDLFQKLSINESRIPEQYIVDDTESVRAYLRGQFLMTGSINDPKTSRYHLEFLVDNELNAQFICELLNQFDLNSKYIKRDPKYMVYIKEAEKIGDFLRIISASAAVLYYEDIRIYRDHKNMTNRLNNCEQANVDRIIETAVEQINDIELIMTESSFDLLDEKEQIVAKYRIKYNEASLQELSEIITIETSKPITKSGLYHRFKKIKQLADKIRIHKTQP